jgi:hypothetical protein
MPFQETPRWAKLIAPGSCWRRFQSGPVRSSADPGRATPRSTLRDCVLPRAEYLPYDRCLADQAVALSPVRAVRNRRHPHRRSRRPPPGSPLAPGTHYLWRGRHPVRTWGSCKRIIVVDRGFMVDPGYPRTGSAAEPGSTAITGEPLRPGVAGALPCGGCDGRGGGRGSRTHRDLDGQPVTKARCPRFDAETWHGEILVFSTPRSRL